MNTTETPKNNPDDLIKVNKSEKYRIVQYPDPDSKSGKVYFADRKKRVRFLRFFWRWTDWEVVKWSTGESIYWFDFKKAVADVEKLKRGQIIYDK